MKIKDLQFARKFIRDYIDPIKVDIGSILDTSIEISGIGDADSLIDRGNQIVIKKPSSLANFLFKLLYSILSKNISSEEKKDQFGIGLLLSINEYIYADYDKTEEMPPVVMSFEKNLTLYSIISELIFPVIGRFDLPPVLSINCNHVDSCSIVKSHDELVKLYNLPRQSVSHSQIPLIALNQSVKNRAAKMADLLFKTMSFSLGEEKAARTIKTILMDQESGLMSHLFEILKITDGDPATIVDFIELLASNVEFSHTEWETHIEAQASIIHKDSYLNQHIRVADQRSQVEHQWSQWSVLQGLIEKQLGPTRGSKWPITEALKPFDERKKKMISDKKKEKGSALNMEELLDVSRDIYNHKAEHGKLIEQLLRRNRVWK